MKVQRSETTWPVLYSKSTVPGLKPNNRMYEAHIQRQASFLDFKYID